MKTRPTRPNTPKGIKMANMMNQCTGSAQKGPGVKMKGSMGSKPYKAGAGMKSPVKGGAMGGSKPQGY